MDLLYLLYRNCNRKETIRLAKTPRREPTRRRLALILSRTASSQPIDPALSTSSVSRTFPAAEIASSDAYAGIVNKEAEHGHAAREMLRPSQKTRLSIVR